MKLIEGENGLEKIQAQDEEWVTIKDSANFLNFNNQFLYHVNLKILT